MKFWQAEVGSRKANIKHPVRLRLEVDRPMSQLAGAKRPPPTDDYDEGDAARIDDKPDDNDDENNEDTEEYQQLKRRRKIEPRGVPWFVMLERLKQYRDRYGSLNVPSTFRKDPKLA